MTEKYDTVVRIIGILFMYVHTGMCLCTHANVHTHTHTKCYNAIKLLY